MTPAARMVRKRLWSSAWRRRRRRTSIQRRPGRWPAVGTLWQVGAEDPRPAGDRSDDARSVGDRDDHEAAEEQGDGGQLPSGLVMSPTTTPMPVETIQTSQTSAPEPRKCHMQARSSVSSGWVMARAKAWSIKR